MGRVARLVLQDGTVLEGRSFGAERNIAGEVVFTTGMVGYPESLTDPSYRGQLLVLTFPLIGNYGVPSADDVDHNGLPRNFESYAIHASALIVGDYTDQYSHWTAKKSLAAWLKAENVPGIQGIDTRALTKKIRSTGSMLGKIILEGMEEPPLDFFDPNAINIVAEVSIKEPKVFSPLEPPATPLHVIAVDVGMKYNQIRCFNKRGVTLKVVPWDYNFLNDDYDGLFISNGPGDPIMCTKTISYIQEAMKKSDKPIFGICLGHQLLALAAGAKTKKMLFGNRGQNIPCIDRQTGRCFITSQNHGFEVDASTLPDGWEELFVNANDNSNEGIVHKTKPFFSVQFHPESYPGPNDVEYLFDTFIDAIRSCKALKEVGPLKVSPHAKVPTNTRVKVNKVLILGSGGLSIGQAGEFDYSGSQAIKALKQEGIYTVLINPNIATIQTSKGLADKVYFLPVNAEFVRKVLQYERPDGIYCSFGGQTALNVGVELKDEFEALGVKVLGTPISTIILTEDREKFASAMLEINERCARSASATSLEQALSVAKKIGYPVIVRAAYALGGLGSGFAENEKQLEELCQKSFAVSPQVLVERSMKGWKEIEYEVVRDCHDNCITVCNMENFDPLGIHTGDSIVVAPSQTLTNYDYHRLRRTAINVIRHLGVVGECNIQFAVNPDSDEYCIIEVNARLSRSSALASKATGYPLAYVAAKLGLGIPLTEIDNSVTKMTKACFEPSLDYIVVKIPRWDLVKFSRVSKKIASAMKSVGEVMAIGRTFEETIQKAIRGVDNSFYGFSENTIGEATDESLSVPTDQRLFSVAQALHKGYTVDRIFDLTKIDKWFLHKLMKIVDFDKHMRQFSIETLPVSDLLVAKRLGFSDQQISLCINTGYAQVRNMRKDAKIFPFVKQIDTVAAEFPAQTNYLYLTYNASENDVAFDDHGIIVLGSGVYRIGSSVEFDWCAVSAIRTLRASNYKTIMINYNPETVSTDYDEADRLYFENITLEAVLDIYEKECSKSVIVSMGGQTPNNIALLLHRHRVPILGTSPEMIDAAENRYKFSRMLDAIGVDQPKWKELTSYEEALTFCASVEYPVLVRPSYVLSGAAMSVVFTEEDLSSYLSKATQVSPEYPVVISKYIQAAKEIEMDAVAQKGEVLAEVISEHIENAGVHSGDATLVLPPQDLDPQTVSKIKTATRKIANALNVTGPFNIQFIAKDNEIKVIECNVRASRSFPFCSKVLNVDLIELATKAMLGLTVRPISEPSVNYVGVKVPQFSFSRLSGADPVLGVEMASTGEVACFGKDKYEAYIKALISTAFILPRKNILLSIGTYKEKMEFLPSVRKLHELGYKLFATRGTADFLEEHAIPITYVEFYDSSPDSSASNGNGYSKGEHAKLEHDLAAVLAHRHIHLYINLPSMNQFRRPASYMSRGYLSRRMAVDFAVPLITNVKCAKLFVEALARKNPLDISIADFKTSSATVTIPGLIDVHCTQPLGAAKKEALELFSRSALSGGFTGACIFLDRAISTPEIFNATKSQIADSCACDFSLLTTVSRQSILSNAFIGTTAGVVVDAVSEHVELAEIGRFLDDWFVDRVVVVQASGAELASLVFLASLSQRAVHVTRVSRKEDIEFIRAAKLKGVQITCDVTVRSLMGIDGIAREDREALWANLDSIDCFSTGTAIASEEDPSAAQCEVIPLLFTALHHGRLTLSDITQRLHTNPCRIFNLQPQEDTYVLVEVDREFKTAHPWPETADLSIVGGRLLKGYVSRVVMRGKPVYVDGVRAGDAPWKGADMSRPVPRRKDSVISLPTKPSGAAAIDAAGGATPAATAVAASAASASVAGQQQAPPPADATQSAPLSSTLAYAERKSANSFFGKSVLSVKSYQRSALHELFTVAHEMRTMVERTGGNNILQGKILCNLFYEPSTRTASSFEAAMKRLGGEVITVHQSTSSVVKGESLADTVRTMDCYVDVIAIRHPKVNSAAEAAKYSSVPVINAGDGVGEHPTQAMLDIYTIREEKGSVNGLDITLVGDLKNGRTTHSLVRLLAFYNVRLHYVSPKSLEMPREVMEELRKQGVEQSEHESLESVISVTDVLYVTRVQKERFDSEEEYDKVKSSYRVTTNLLTRAKEDMIVMHPLPRVDELDAAVDDDSRAAYFRQMRYGLYIRMALLKSILLPS